MTSRKNKKSNKRFRKTRSKKQKGGANPMLLKAVKLGDLDKVKRALDMPTDVNLKDDNGDTALHIAIKLENIKIVELIFTRRPRIKVNIQNSEGDTALHIAIKLENIEIVKLLLEKERIDVKIANKKGYTALHNACNNTRDVEEIVELLLEKEGIDIDVVIDDELEDTALILASRKGHTEIVKILLAKGANMAAENANGETALNIIKELIKNNPYRREIGLLRGNYMYIKAGLEQQEAYNIAAAREESQPEVESQPEDEGQFVPSSPDWSPEDEGHTLPGSPDWSPEDEGHIPPGSPDWGPDEQAEFRSLTQEEKNKKLLDAVEEEPIKFEDAIQALAEGANVDAKEVFGNTALMYASAYNHIELVKILLKKGANVNETDNDGDTALHSASENGNTEIVDLLKEAIANNTENNSSDEIPVNEVPVNEIPVNEAPESQEEKDTKLFKAVVDKINEDKEIRRKRKVEDDEIRHEQEEEEEATREAKLQMRLIRQKEDKIRREHEEEVINKALKNGANVNRSNDTGSTVLHIASFYGHEEIMKILLKQDGIDMNVVNNDGSTALTLAIAKDKKKITENHISTVKLLLDKGVDITSKDRFGWTALTIAITEGNISIVKLLLDKGADVNTKYEDSTGLITASIKGNIIIVNMLLKKKADVNAQNKNGDTALIKASTRGKIEHIEIVDMLLDEKADVNMKNNNGSTALIEASGYGQPKIVKILLKKGADINAENIKGALQIARDNERTKVVKLLEKFNKKPEENFIMDSIDKELTYYDEDAMEATITIEDYLQKDKDNIIFVYKSLKKDVDLDYFVTTRDYITEKYNDNHSVFYGCNKKITYFIPKKEDFNKNNVYLGLSTIGLQTSTQYCDIQTFLDNEDHQLFAIKNLNTNYPSFVAKHVLGRDPNVVSASHCQGGDAASVSTLIKAYSKDFCTISNIKMLQETSEPRSKGGFGGKKKTKRKNKRKNKRKTKRNKKNKRK